MGASIVPLAVAGASGMTNLLSTHLTNEANKSSVNATNNSNERISQENLAIQQQENAINRDFQREMANYYSPVELVKRIQEAGLNPNVLLSNGSGSVSSTPSGYQSGLSPIMPNITPFNRIAPQVGSDFIDAVSKLSEAKRNTSEANKVDRTLSAYLDSLKESAEGQRIANSIQSTYGSLLAESQVSESVHRSLLLYKQAEQAASQKDLNQVKILTERAQQELNRSMSQLNGQKARNMQLANETFMREFEARMKELQSRTSLQGAQAVTENALRSERLEVLRADARMQNASAGAQELVNKINEAVDKEGYLINAKRSELSSMINKEHIDKLSAKEKEAIIEYIVDQQKFETEKNHPQNAAYWSDLLKSFLKAGGNAAASYAGARIGR